MRFPNKYKNCCFSTTVRCTVEEIVYLFLCLTFFNHMKGRRGQKSLKRMSKIWLTRRRDTVQCQVVKKKKSLYIAFLLIPTWGKSGWTSFLMKVQTAYCVSKNSVLCSFHFAVDSFTNMAQFNTGFSERLKLKDDALPTILDPTVMLQVWQHKCEQLFLLRDHYCFVC